MTTRWRLLLLLLALTLTPLVALSAIHQLALRHLGNELAAAARDRLTRDAASSLRRGMNDFVRVVDREKRLVETIVTLQARGIERLLAEPPPQDQLVFSPSDVDTGRVPDLQSSPDHAPEAALGATASETIISFSTHVIRRHEGAVRASIDADVARLAPATRIYQESRRFFPEGLLWQYTTLESGVQSRFPGHGARGGDADPRQSNWYLNSRTGDQLRWFSPQVDPITGRAVLTATLPLRRPDGTFAGVTAIDVPMGRVLEQTRLPARWAADTQLMLVTMLSADECRALGLVAHRGGMTPVVVAENSTPNGTPSWRHPSTYRALSADDPEAFDRAMADFHAGRMGVRELMYRGRPTVWSYGPIDRANQHSTFLVSIVPSELIVADAITTEQRVLELTWTIVQTAGLLAVIAIAIVIVMAWRESRRVAQPVMQIADTADRIAGGDLEARVPEHRRGDELGRMARAFNAMVPKLRDRVRIRESLHLAMQVQQSLLPSAPPAHEGLDIAGQSIYCDETGGDYFDFIELGEVGERRLGIAVGDVVGHGVAAALLMATVRALLRSHVRLVDELDRLFSDVNRHLCDSGFTGRFMTLFFLLLDAEQQRIHWIGAGHDPAIVYDPMTDAFAELEGADIPIGLDAGWTFQTFTSEQWRPGQILVLGTDGVWECFNDRREMFGKERLRDVIRAHAGSSAARISAAIRDAVDDHRGNAEQTDDLTLVVVKII